MVVLAKQNHRYLVMDSGFLRLRPYELPALFNETVPGWVGDPRAPYDPELQKSGWRYVDDPDFIVYSSLDYDASGGDTSGNNYNDWPLRRVGNRIEYVADPLGRQAYRPAYRSDEDLFVVYKDTDARANQLYTGPEGPSVPLGLEIQLTVFTWATGSMRDMVLFSWDVINKGEDILDSCYLGFSPALQMTSYDAGFTMSNYGARIHPGLPRPHLWSLRPFDDPNHPWSQLSRIPPGPPTIGYSVSRDPDRV